MAELAVAEISRVPALESDERQLQVSARATQLFSDAQDSVVRRTDRLFAWLLLGQWIFAIAIALTLSPYAWAGKQSAVHVHVYAALGLGALLNSLPWLLVWRASGAIETRIAIACAQMLWSALLIHLTGGRIETHFHVFGSLAILAFYRDPRVLVPATIVVAADHFIRGLYWPESVYGVQNPEWWRFLEHAAWVVFIDVFLLMHCFQGTREMRENAEKQAEVEVLSESERKKSAALDSALSELQASQEALVRTERLAAVGQLAASVGHELRNPLAAVMNATTYIGRKIDAGKTQAALLADDPRVQQFRSVIDRELNACNKIIADLLDFARSRPPNRQPCPLKALVDESIELVPKRANIELVNEVPGTLAVPEIDKDQMRQVFVNLLQNASEAIADGNQGRVIARAEASNAGWQIRVIDNGHGMAPDVTQKIFQPLFSTKTKGTGLGLAIVSGTLERHGASIRVDSAPGRGTTFVIELPKLTHSTKSAELKGHAYTGS